MFHLLAKFILHACYSMENIEEYNSSNSSIVAYKYCSYNNPDSRKIGFCVKHK